MINRINEWLDKDRYIELPVWVGEYLLTVAVKFSMYALIFYSLYIILMYQTIKFTVTVVEAIMHRL